MTQKLFSLFLSHSLPFENIEAGLLLLAFGYCSLLKMAGGGDMHAGQLPDNICFHDNLLTIDAHPNQDIIASGTMDGNISLWVKALLCKLLNWVLLSFPVVWPHVNFFLLVAWSCLICPLYFSFLFIPSPSLPPSFSVCVSLSHTLSLTHIQS